ncbi:MAG: hypothetical protein JWQ02_2723 [Capsulimonas sp.]|jgi:hypothetical protein|nr:hypothetical protein [Capsulimonas sp.]
MGFWDMGLIADDTALEVYDLYLARYDSGAEYAAIQAEIEERYAAVWDDIEDGCVVRFGLAHAQWECGALSSELLAHVEMLIKGKKAITHWEEIDEDDRHKRKSALARFLGKIQTPKAKPRRRRTRPR